MGCTYIVAQLSYEQLLSSTLGVELYAGCLYTVSMAAMGFVGKLRM